MQVIGVTGGVGSGKSTITNILKDKYGIYLIDTDKIAHLLMKKGEISYNLIVEYFGPEILDNEGNINRSYLGDMVYKDRKEVEKLNSFTHPYVMERVKEIIEEKQKANFNYVCVETALPVEAKLKSICHQIWYVYTPVEIRRKRLKESRNYSDEKIDHIMKQQLSDKEYMDYSTHVIYNVSSKDNLIRQIEEKLKE